MSDNFEYALPFIRQKEGGWVHDPADSGAETYAGVSRANFPQWRGWPIINNAKAGMVPQPAYGTTAYRSWVAYLDKLLAGNLTLQNAVAQFYEQNFWMTAWDRLDKRVAAKVMDTSVNNGLTWGPKILQRALGVIDDGIVGAITIVGANGMDTDTLLEAMHQKLKQHYAEIVAAHPGDQKYLDNWDERAAWIPAA